MSSRGAGRFGDRGAQRQEVATLLADDPRLRNEDVALVTLIGSKAYGMAGPHSDNDYKGVYVAGSDIWLGLDEPTGAIEGNDPDFAIFELGKFCGMAMKANPNALEALWGPQMQSSRVGRRLIENRSLFLSQRIKGAYGGFAHSQLKLIDRHERLRSDTEPEKVRKSIRHLFRVLEQGESLLRYGDMDIAIQDPDRYEHYCSLSCAEVTEMFRSDLDPWFAGIPSDLPRNADREQINALVRDIRFDAIRDHVDRGGGE